MCCAVCKRRLRGRRWDTLRLLWTFRPASLVCRRSSSMAHVLVAGVGGPSLYIHIVHTLRWSELGMPPKSANPGLMGAAHLNSAGTRDCQVQHCPSPREITSKRRSHIIVAARRRGCTSFFLHDSWTHIPSPSPSPFHLHSISIPSPFHLRSISRLTERLLQMVCTTVSPYVVRISPPFACRCSPHAASWRVSCDLRSISPPSILSLLGTPSTNYHRE
ncbi:hypothetical protein P280DRAFT_128446 [Massarina eburnea CBS 473.64]|uniref:Uncharacterized protein n=1 Tax=Massarina eburnea CBS 473.64 TaxID=1395130 RepID=A0A6A6SD89_9PLEO|nr:hypothetical protein P280DRAFT_128446 [Massarina eburnea CBS 473.64]